LPPPSSSKVSRASSPPSRLGALKGSGFAAWLLWSVAHIYFLIGFRNRLAVALHWFWNYVTFQRGTRLITGISGSRIEDVVPVVTTAPPTADVGHAHRSSRIADAYGRESPQHVRRDRILERPNEKRYSPLVDCCCPICSPGAIR
jgi:NADH:quinone reductase (non-electrogenic)